MKGCSQLPCDGLPLMPQNGAQPSLSPPHRGGPSASNIGVTRQSRTRHGNTEANQRSHTSPTLCGGCGGCDAAIHPSRCTPGLTDAGHWCPCAQPLALDCHCALEHFVTLSADSTGQRPLQWCERSLDLQCTRAPPVKPSFPQTATPDQEDKQHTAKGHDHSFIRKRTRFDGCRPLVALSFIAETARVTDAEHYRGSITHASLQNKRSGTRPQPHPSCGSPELTE